MSRVLIILAFFLSITNNTALGVKPVQEQKWTPVAQDVLEEVNRENYSEAKIQLTKLRNLFSKGNFAKNSLSLDAINALGNTLLDLDAALNKTQLNATKVKSEALKMYLAFDAAEHKSQPVWKQFRRVLNDRINGLQEAIEVKNRKGVDLEIRAVQEITRILRPALIISVEPSTIKKLDSFLTVIKTPPLIGDPSFLQVVIDFKAYVQQLFSSEPAVLSISSVDSITSTLSWSGGLIFCVLLYIWWRNKKLTPPSL